MCNHSYNNFITHPVAQELWNCLQHLTELRLQFTNPVGSLWKQLSDGRTEAFQILNCFCQEWWLGNRYPLPSGNQVCFSFRSCQLHKSHQLGQRLVIINQSSVMLVVTHSYKCHDRSGSLTLMKQYCLGIQKYAEGSDSISDIRRDTRAESGDCHWDRCYSYGGDGCKIGWASVYLVISRARKIVNRSKPEEFGSPKWEYTLYLYSVFLFCLKHSRW